MCTSSYSTAGSQVLSGAWAEEERSAEVGAWRKQRRGAWVARAESSVYLRTSRGTGAARSLALMRSTKWGRYPVERLSGKRTASSSGVVSRPSSRDETRRMQEKNRRLFWSSCSKEALSEKGRSCEEKEPSSDTKAAAEP